MSRLHPDTRKFGAKFAVPDDRPVTEDHEAEIKDQLARSIVEKMEQEGMRAIGAVLHTRERVPFPNEEDLAFYVIEYRAIQLGLPLGVRP
jgi:hypothetical protein